MENVSVKAIQGLIRDLTASDDDELDSDKLKKLKSICKCDTVGDVGDYLIKRLSSSNHSQVRLQCFKVIDHLFRRSSLLRSCVVSQLKIIITSSFGLNVDKPLPPPRSARDSLIRLSRRSLAEWTSEFSDKYPKLTSTSLYLKEHHNCDVNAESRERQESASKMSRLWTDRCRSVVNEMEEKQSYINEVSCQLQNAIDILVPSSFLEEDFSEEVQDEEDFSEEVQDEEDDSGRSNGVLNHNHSVTTVDLSIPSFMNPDNKILVDTIRELMKVLRNKLIPLATKWVIIFEKANPYVSEFNCQKDLAEGIQNKLEKLEQICLRLHLPPESHSRGSDEESEDDEFEDVPEKEGYEESCSEPCSHIEPWKDRKELKELEAKMGVKLIFDKERKRKLTPLKTDKARNRLEKIVFNRSSLKRVREDKQIELQNSSKKSRY